MRGRRFHDRYSVTDTVALHTVIETQQRLGNDLEAP
jgi:hypothetical protein